MPRKPDSITIIGSRLKEAIVRSGMTHKQVGAPWKYSGARVGQWIKENKLPPDLFIPICERIKVSPQYLLGESDDPNDLYQEPDGTYVFTDHLELLMMPVNESLQRQREIIEERKAQGIPIMSESEVLLRRKRERDNALQCLKELLNTGYMYPSWERIESDTALSDLLDDILIYIQSLPEPSKKRKRGK